ncbi:MAG TPA: hypothetical protein VL614_03310, partial [Acetobacteraceae bacterium]|nr:hypothetical protein [Acetobacteraceae bacterium]
SSPHAAFFANAIAPANIPIGAWIVVCVGTGGWGATIANRLVLAGHAADHIWIYTRLTNAVGFGIDKFGQFGEIRSGLSRREVNDNRAVDEAAFLRSGPSIGNAKRG